MTLNRQRLLRYTEYAAVSASVAGAIAAVMTRQVIYGVAPLSVAAALNLASRRQWEHQIEQRLTETTTQVGQHFDRLNQRNKLIEHRLNELPQQPISDLPQSTDLQTLREEGSRLIQALTDDIHGLRQSVAQQATRSSLEVVSTELRQLQQSLAALEALNLENRLQALEQLPPEQQPVVDSWSLLIQALTDDIQGLRQSVAQQATRSSLEVVSTELRQLQQSLAALEAFNLENRLQALEQQPVVDSWSLPIAQLNTDLSQLKADFTQLRQDIDRLEALLRAYPSKTQETVEAPAGAQPSSDFYWVPPQLPSTQDFTLDINLGIDFGTGFTKVCFRDLSSDRAEIVTFSEPDEADLEQALLCTKVAILNDGTLLTGLTAAEWAENNQPIQKTIEFIKMRLAHLDLPEEAEWRLDQVAELDDPEIVENICAYFLSTVITRAQDWIQQNRSDLFKNQKPRWSINIGVPVEYCDSSALVRFQQVLSLAWLLANTPSSKHPLTINSLKQLGTCLRQWRQHNEDQPLDCFTTPEISAAVWSFLSSRQAVEKFYTFFDFGDGTLDGTAFRFWREDEGELKVDFFTGKVRPLGVTAFTQQTALELHTTPEAVRQALLDWQSETDNDLHNDVNDSQIRHQIKQLVGAVVIGGKKQHENNRRLVAVDELGDYLDIFISGGGGHNPFFEGTVQATYEDFQHKNAGVPPYRIRRIPVPNNLSMNGLGSKEFHRFAVAYGLCIPGWEGPEIRLPSEVESNANATLRRPGYETNHEDMKDVT
jgi:HPt (histidine-containing phosphotransfer) domain-containing protein